MPLAHLQSLVLVQSSGNLYNILIALVCGFSSLNILNLLTRRAQPVRGLNFSEMLAVTGAVVSLFLWGVEMFHLLNIFPIKLQP
ncbi:MAG: hypothetical protein ACLPOO_11360 [Terriglobales bacterium]|jgi:uncharacterized membrane protein YeaQ/YmgE (transglycosylase-associated protein family)